VNPLILSAQFAAYVWYTKRFAAGKETDAAVFAKFNWPKFLPVAHAGLGRLLGKIATKTSKTNTKQKPPTLRLAKLKTLARALSRQEWPQAG
jgi:hypothetical protein